MNNKVSSLRCGKQYQFMFTHKVNVRGIVCDIDNKNNTFVVYDINTKGYENIPQHRFISAILL
jgi:hypothetical protein